jgi:hypothetical protein
VKKIMAAFPSSGSLAAIATLHPPRTNRAGKDHWCVRDEHEAPRRSRRIRDHLIGDFLVGLAFPEERGELRFRDEACLLTGAHSAHTMHIEVGNQQLGSTEWQ